MKNKHAILIMAHNNQFTLTKIIKLLDSELFDIYLHIDKKSNLMPCDFEKLTTKSRVFVYKEIDVRWADYSQTETEMFLLKKAVNKNYSYYHLISGNDFILKTPQEIYTYFENSKKIFVHFASEKLPSNKIPWVKYYHLFMPYLRNNYFWIFLDKLTVYAQKMFGVNRLKKIKEIEIMTGANWFSITDSFAKYVVSNSDIVEKIFKNTRSSDEMFIQTLLYNSSFFKYNYNKKFDDDYDACKRYIKWNGDIPKVLDLSDFDDMINSNMFFARKVDENVDKELIYRLDEYLSIKKSGGVSNE